MRSTTYDRVSFPTLTPSDTVQKASGIPSRLWTLWGKTPICSSIRRLDAERNPEPVNAEFSINADADQVPKIQVRSHPLLILLQPPPSLQLFALRTLQLIRLFLTLEVDQNMQVPLRVPSPPFLLRIKLVPRV